MSSASTPCILVVEDDPVVAAIYERVLQRPDWTVVIAGTLAAADRALAQDPVSLVVLDLFLPDGDGRPWLRTLRTQPAHSGTPVIVVAGTSVAKAGVDGYELGADTMLEKPVPPAVLLAAVNGALQRTTPRAPPPPPPPPPEPPPTPTTRRVLVADDDEVVALLVTNRLMREGFDVVHVTHGLDALDAASRMPFAPAIHASACSTRGWRSF